MRLTRAAVGLAALGASWLVARMLGTPATRVAEDSPDPNDLIGEPLADKDARSSAEVLEGARQVH
ncbi:MAG: hypothetical protein ACM31L_05155 [Actinomycetota bacterium]